MPNRIRPYRFALADVALATFAVVGVGGLLAPAPASSQSPAAIAAPTDAVAAVTKVLDDQTAAWNRGDLDTFLEGYWKSPKVVFQSGGARYDGFDAMRDRYRKSYQTDGKAMGKLAFPTVEIEPMGPDAAFVRGNFLLTMPDGTQPSGLFTLICRRFDNGWKITHDHTSTAQPAPAPVPAPPAATTTPKSPI